MTIAKALMLAELDRDGPPWPTAPAQERQLFPIANRPVFVHNLEALHAAGVSEAAIFAERTASVAIERAVGDGRHHGVTLRYADWDPRVGVAGALAAGRDFVGGDPVVVQHGDALLREPMDAHVTSFVREDLDALALRLPAPPSVLTPRRTPWYLLSPKAIAILADGSPGAGNPVNGIRASGGRVRIQLVDGCVPRQEDVEALLESNRRLLAEITSSVHDDSLDGCTVQGPVQIDPTARLRNTLVRGPAVIGAAARITDAYIGPYTSIGADVVVEGTEIEHSIVLPAAELRFVGTRLESSVVGRRARVVRRFHLPGALRMSIGDGAEVMLA